MEWHWWNWVFFSGTPQVSFKGVLTLLSQMTYSHPISISGLKQSKVFGGGSHFGEKQNSKP